MAITKLLPAVKALSHTDKLLLLQVLMQALLEAESGAAQVHADDSAHRSVEVPAAVELPTTTEDKEDEIALEKRYAFLKKPLEERRRILAEQAETMQFHYEQNTEWKELMAGDIVDY
ncbi:MAG: hypothetical protein AAF921_21350 [Cyanobacteria bacterium P01_D01_bin.44]